jgi:pilus assembly protein CpaB
MSRRLILAGLLLCGSSVLGVVAIKGVRPPAAAPAPVAAATPAPAPVALPVAMLVAAGPLPPGTLVREQDLATSPVPAEALPEGALVDAPALRAELRGALIREWVDAGAPIRRESVLRPRDRGFLAAVLKPGSRAVAIGVDAVTGAAGLVAPGDLVDLILTQDFPRDQARPAERVVSETILTGARLIAVDQQITQGAPAVEPGAPLGRVARTVTLEVKPAEAERVAVAERLGRLSLSVRAIEPDAEPEAKRGATFAADVSPALTPRSNDVPIRMRVFQNGEMTEVVFR